MNLMQIALNNLKRRKVKMLFIMMGLVVGVSTVVAFINIIQAMNMELGDRIDEFGANAIILPRSEGLEVHYGNAAVSDLTYEIEDLTLDDIPKIFESSVAEYINIVSPKLIGGVDVGQQKSILVGIDTRWEFTQKPWLALEESPESNGQFYDLSLVELADEDLILGYTAARALGVAAGDQLTINDEAFRVFGVLNKVGSEEDGLIYAKLPVVQRILNKPNQLSMIEVSAYCNSCPIEEIVVGLEEALPHSRVIALRQAALFREETIQQFSVFGYALSGMVMIIAALVVLTTMMSSINERTREIGIFRAIGFRRSHVMTVIFLEVGIIGILSGVVGFVFGSLSASLAGPFLAQLQGQVPMQLNLLLPAIVLSTGLAIISSAYPALKAAKLDPAEALRFI